MSGFSDLILALAGQTMLRKSGDLFLAAPNVVSLETCDQQGI